MRAIAADEGEAHQRPIHDVARDKVSGDRRCLRVAREVGAADRSERRISRDVIASEDLVEDELVDLQRRAALPGELHSVYAWLLCSRIDHLLDELFRVRIADAPAFRSVDLDGREIPGEADSDAKGGA